MLRGLGWNTEDPLQVVPEYSIPSEPSKAADYALFAQHGRAQNNVPVVIVEAKKLDTTLTAAAIQALQYCMVDGFEYFVVTDGNKWQLFETLRKGNLEGKLVVQFDLRSHPMADVCRKALALWRQGFEENAVRVRPRTVPERTRVRHSRFWMAPYPRLRHGLVPVPQTQRPRQPRWLRKTGCRFRPFHQRPA